MDATIYGDAGVLVATLPDTKNPVNMMGLAGMYDMQGKQLLQHEYENIDPALHKNAIVLSRNDLRSLVNAKGAAFTTKWYKTLVFSDISHFIGPGVYTWQILQAGY